MLVTLCESNSVATNTFLSFRTIPVCGPNRLELRCMRRTEGIFGGMGKFEMDERLEGSGFLPMIGIPVSPGIQIGVSQQVHRRPRKAALAPATAALLFAGSRWRSAASKLFGK
jgi:hypothetical protein